MVVQGESERFFLVSEVVGREGGCDRCVVRLGPLGARSRWGGDDGRGVVGDAMVECRLYGGRYELAVSVVR